MVAYKKPLSLRSIASIRELRAFAAVYHAGTLSAAAERLSLSQPAVTMLLRGLEEKLGVRLFDRNTRAVRRTDAANRAIDFVEQALRQLESLSDEMAGLARGDRGRVRVIATSSFAQTLLPPVIRRYVDAWPEVRFSLDDCAPRDFVETILADRVDFGVGTLEAPVPDLVERVLLTDTLHALAARGPHFATARPISGKQLAALPLITVKGGYGVRRSIDAAALAAGVALNVAHEVALLTTAIAMAAAGLGVAVVPGSLRRYMRHADLVGRPIDRPVVERRFAVVHRRDRPLSRPSEHFVALLEAELGPGRGKRKS